MNSFEGYAFDAGVRVGDKILKVDGKDVRDIPVAGWLTRCAAPQNN
jgi:C-terminal processing protease CtpA/Prc